MLTTLRKPRKKPVDGTLLTVMILLMMLGLLTLFSATYYKALETGNPWDQVVKQLFGAAVGAAAMAVTCRVPYAFWRRRKVVLSAVVLAAQESGALGGGDRAEREQVRQAEPDVTAAGP